MANREPARKRRLNTILPPNAINIITRQVMKGTPKNNVSDYLSWVTSSSGAWQSHKRVQQNIARARKAAANAQARAWRNQEKREKAEQLQRSIREYKEKKSPEVRALFNKISRNVDAQTIPREYAPYIHALDEAFDIMRSVNETIDETLKRSGILLPAGLATTGLLKPVWTRLVSGQLKKNIRAVFQRFVGLGWKLKKTKETYTASKVINGYTYEITFWWEGKTDYYVYAFNRMYDKTNLRYDDYLSFMRFRLTRVENEKNDDIDLLRIKFPWPRRMSHLGQKRVADAFIWDVRDEAIDASETRDDVVLTAYLASRLMNRKHAYGIPKIKPYYGSRFIYYLLASKYPSSS